MEDETLSGKNILIHAKQNDVKVKISLDESCDIFKYNLMTYATTNGGFNTLYQGTVLAFKKPVDLEPGKTLAWKMNITLA